MGTKNIYSIVTYTTKDKKGTVIHTVIHYLGCRLIDVVKTEPKVFTKEFKNRLD